MNEFQGLTKAVDFLSAKYDDQTQEMNDMKEENVLLKKRLTEQERKIEEMEQYGKRNNVLFDYVPEKPKENAVQLISEKCKQLGVTIEKGDIQIAHIIGISQVDKPRPLIARFASASTAKQVLMAVKWQYSKENTTKPIECVRAREHLTEQRGRLLKDCVKLKKDNRIHACWIYNYTVYVKKSKDDAKGLKVTNDEDLMHLVT
jgi:hypothetical protein